MPGAGLYSIHTSKISFRSDGRWYADDEPFVHPRLALLFSRHLRRKADGGYEIWIDERYHADVEVEDTPYVATGVTGDAQGRFMLHLNDGTTEPLDPETLQVGRGNVLYCRVKNGTARARFLRPAYYQLSDFIEEAAPGHFQIRCGGTTYPIERL
jgi:hypothetical protein